MTEDIEEMTRVTEAGEWHFRKDLCKGCGLCVEVCESGALEFSSELGPYGSYVVQPSEADCTGCGQCADTCPDGAITLS